jgi:hypothetical protein
MAAKLINYYTLASNEFGIAGRMKLAMLTKVPSEKAATEPDTPDNIRIFEDALTQLRRAA